MKSLYNLSHAVGRYISSSVLGHLVYRVRVLHLAWSHFEEHRTEHLVSHQLLVVRVFPVDSPHFSFSKFACKLVQSVFEPLEVYNSSIFQIKVSKSSFAGISLIILDICFVSDLFVHVQLDFQNSLAGHDPLVDSKGVDEDINKILKLRLTILLIFRGECRH